MHRACKLFFHWFCKFFFTFYCPLRVYGKENLPNSAYIFCSNHCSHMDTPALMMASGLSFNAFGMVAAKDYFFSGKKQPGIAKLFMNLIPISRQTNKQSLQDDLAQCKQFVAEGKRNLIIYPEGTRSLSGKMTTFKKGAAMIAVALDMPIVPVFIQGTRQALGKGRSWPHPGVVKLFIGKPIVPAEWRANTALATYRNITDIVQKSIVQMESQYEQSNTDEMVGMGRSEQNIQYRE